MGLGAGFAPRLAGNRRLAAVLALAEFSGPLPPFVGKVPLVLYALWALVSGLFVFPEVLVCVASLGRGCFLMGVVTVELVDTAFRLRRATGSSFRVLPVLRFRVLAGTSRLGGIPFALGAARQGEGRTFSPRAIRLLVCPACGLPGGRRIVYCTVAHPGSIQNHLMKCLSQGRHRSGSSVRRNSLISSVWASTASGSARMMTGRPSSPRPSLFRDLVLVASVDSVRLHSLLLRPLRRISRPGPEGREGPGVLAGRK